MDLREINDEHLKKCLKKKIITNDPRCGSVKKQPYSRSSRQAGPAFAPTAQNEKAEVGAFAGQPSPRPWPRQEVQWFRSAFCSTKSLLFQIVPGHQPAQQSEDQLSNLRKVHIIFIVLPVNLQHFPFVLGVW